ncbi:hypothetical protein ACO22_07585 [Paracoccidioides brasiliensis]|uniref:Uncharacterized protein n=1 Tax=Paracoccidioides brasiliensis TaxID=121759 RepID=A0A1D2J4A5_PARBR|nr:hypothetical protein ACO22_07585 [Paracoccidioides brasiliensis]
MIIQYAIRACRGWLIVQPRKPPIVALKLKLPVLPVAKGITVTV